MKVFNNRSLVIASFFGLATLGLSLGGTACKPSDDNNSSNNGGSGGKSESGGSGGKSEGSGSGGNDEKGGSGGNDEKGGSGGNDEKGGSGGNSGGNGGNSEKGGSGGGGSGGGTSTEGECTGVVPKADLVSDFSDATGTDTITLGNGGIFIYPATSGPVAKVDGGALKATASVPAGSYWGFGIYFTDCTDGSAYSGVKFNIKGTTTCPMKLGANISVDDKDSGPGKAGCTGTCYGPNAPIAAADITSDGKDVTIKWADMAGGSPVTTVGDHKKALTGIGWQFASTEACTADVTVDNVEFVK